MLNKYVIIKNRAGIILALGQLIAKEDGRLDICLNENCGISIAESAAEVIYYFNKPTQAILNAMQAGTIEEPPKLLNSISRGSRLEESIAKYIEKGPPTVATRSGVSLEDLPGGQGVISRDKILRKRKRNNDNQSK